MIYGDLDILETLKLRLSAANSSFCETSQQLFYHLSNNSITIIMRRAVHLFGKAFRETGQALDRLGLTVAENELYKETFARHRPVMNLFDKVIITRPAYLFSLFVHSAITSILILEKISFGCADIILCVEFWLVIY